MAYDADTKTLTFFGQALKLNTEVDGEFQLLLQHLLVVVTTFKCHECENSIPPILFNLPVAPVAEKIKEASPLEVLCLEGCTVAPEAAKEIGKAMESKSELKRMLFQDMFTGRLKTEIPHCLVIFTSSSCVFFPYTIDVTMKKTNS